MMKKIKKTYCFSRLPLPFLLAAAVSVAGCSGDQLGDTNGGFVAGGSTATTVGVIGGVLLAGVLLASDDDSDSAVGGTATGGTTGTATGGTTGTATGGTTGTATGGTTGTATGGTTGTATGGTTGTATGGTTGTATGGTTGSTTGGTTTGGNTGPVTLGSVGAFQTDLLADETVPVASSNGTAIAAIGFDRVTGDASGTVTLSGISVTPDTRVDIMVGPPGANGFVAIELEMTGPNTWTLPQTLSDDQKAFVLQNINSGNLYVAVRSNSFPNGELRRQILPANVVRYTTTDTGTTGGTAEGYLMVNTVSGEYAVTWNTQGAEPLASGHINDGVVSGNAENVLVGLSQRMSNPEQFFSYGNFTNVNDPLTDLLTRLGDTNGIWLDAHAVSDDSRVFHGRLQSSPF